MKIHVVFDSGGNIIGIARPGPIEKMVDDEDANVDIGIAAQPGQSIHEVNVPDEMLEYDGPDLIKRLADVKDVKEALDKLIIAGQADYSGQ